VQRLQVVLIVVGVVGVPRGLLRDEYPAPMPRKSYAVTELDRVMRELAKAKPVKAYSLLHRAFLVFAAAGELEHAGALIRLAYDAQLPRPSKLVDTFGTGPMDAICVVGRLGDLTKGVPVARHLTGANSLADRVRLSERLVRGRIIRDAYTQLPPPTGNWSALEGLELWRTRIERSLIAAAVDDRAGAVGYGGGMGCFAVEIRSVA
jgi:hypothetical protein